MRSTRMRWFVGACALLVGTFVVCRAAQTPTRAPSPAERAVRALNEGRYDEVDGLLKADTGPQAAALRARAAVARGRYADAEAVLKAPAAANPASDAALELGRLLMLLGRRADASRVLQRVLDATPRTAAEYARTAAAARAL